MQAVPTKQLSVSTVRRTNHSDPSIISVEVGERFVFMTGGGGQPIVLATTDGKTLARRMPPSAQGLRGAKLIDGELWVVGEYGTCAITTDRAESWTDVAIKSSACLWDVAKDAKGEYWIAGSHKALLRGRNRKLKSVKHALKPRDERADPRVETVPAGVLFPVFNALWDGKALVKPRGLSGANSALATSPTTGTIVMVGDKGGVSRSTDGGKTFKAVKTGVSADFNDIAFVAGGFIAVGGKGTLRRSEDDGLTWKPMSSGTNLELWSIGSWGTGAFIGAEYGTVFRIDVPGDTYWKGATDDFAPKPVVPAKLAPLQAASQAKRDARFEALFAEATAAHAKLAAKLKPSRHAPSDHDASILAALDDADTYGVVGDALQTAGDPRGELIALQIANPKSKEAAALLKKHRAALVGALGEPGYKLDWRWGYIQAARLANPHGDDWFEDDAEESDMPAMFEALLAHESARYLQRLTLGLMSYEGNGYDEELKILGRSPLPALRSLHIGDFDQEECEISWSDIGDLSKIYGAVPNLEQLVLRSGKMKLGTIVLPRLETLDIITGGFNKQSLASIEKALLPSLETLSLTFGEERYGCDVGWKDLKKLLASDRFPRLGSLGLANAGFADHLAGMMHTSSLVAQVKTLDLSMGTLSDAGAHTLATYAGGLQHLEQLDVSSSFLTKRGIGLLKKAFPNTKILAEHQRLREGREYEERYVAISE